MNVVLLFTLLLTYWCAALLGGEHSSAAMSTEKELDEIRLELADLMAPMPAVGTVLLKSVPGKKIKEFVALDGSIWIRNTIFANRAQLDAPWLYALGFKQTSYLHDKSSEEALLRARQILFHNLIVGIERRDKNAITAAQLDSRDCLATSVIMQDGAVLVVTRRAAKHENSKVKKIYLKNIWLRKRGIYGDTFYTDNEMPSVLLKRRASL